MIKSVDHSYEDQCKQIYGYQSCLSLVWLGYTQRPVVDDEDDCFELAVPVGDGDACDASNKVGKKSNLKSTGSTTERCAPTKKIGYKRSRKEIAEKVKASLKKN